ncbi:MAG: 16S rRNA (guanine(966)-N(2))-methyltransferase RsmD [Hyphomicrobiaceae bacterium]
MRIVSGRFKGRRLARPSGGDLRPTSDKVRESIFNILSHGRLQCDLEGAHVLDLFAGTGALGIEALSRGAATCLFVETDVASRALIQENINAFGLGGVSRLFRRDATLLGPANQTGQITIAFADPPYGQQLAERALISAIDGRWLASGASIVIEEARDAAVALPPSLMVCERRTYGETQIVVAKFQPAILDDA